MSERDKVFGVVQDYLRLFSTDEIMLSCAATDIIRELNNAGFAIVPIEPTTEMITAGWNAGIGHRADVWRAMVRAA